MSKSKTSSKRLRRGQVFVVSAPSGGGKSTLLKRLMEEWPDCVLSVSYTTRRPRNGEQDGRDYYFVDATTFRRMVKRQDFLESAQVHEHSYGTSRRQVERLRQQGRDVFLDIDVQGARQIRRKMRDAILIFIVPPSLDVLKQRLISRRTESASALDVRLRNATREIRAAVGYDYIVLNDQIEKALNDFKSIIRSHRLQTERVISEQPVRELLKRVRRLR